MKCKLEGKCKNCIPMKDGCYFTNKALKEGTRYCLHYVLKDKSAAPTQASGKEEVFVKALKVVAESKPSSKTVTYYIDSNKPEKKSKTKSKAKAKKSSVLDGIREI